MPSRRFPPTAHNSHSPLHSSTSPLHFLIPIPNSQFPLSPPNPNPQKPFSTPKSSSMEKNYSFSSHPNSRDSSPTSREVDNDNASFDEPPPTTTVATATATNSYKVKFMCSYGGKIQPRPHGNQLSYVGGETKILAVDRNIKFSAVMAKLSSLSNNADVCFKYQLPGEDLDALISVTNDEDLEHMMVEYDRMCRASPRPARMRLVLFPLNTSSATKFESKPERQWFVDALNSVQIPLPEASSPPPPPPVNPDFPANPDFLFGLDNAYPAVPAAKPPDPAPAPAVPDFAARGSECGSDERQAVGEPDVQRQIQELQRLQLGNNEQRKIDEENGRVYGVDYYPQKNPEKVTPLTAQAHMQVHSGPVHVPGPVPVQVSFLSDMHNHNPSGGGGYSLAVSSTGTEPHPFYLIQTPSGIYQAVRPVTVTGPVGPTYYAVPRMVPAAAEVYNAAPPASLSHSHSASKIAYNGSQVGVVSEHGYSQVANLPEKSRAAAAPGGDGWN